MILITMSYNSFKITLSMFIVQTLCTYVYYTLHNDRKSLRMITIS